MQCLGNLVSGFHCEDCVRKAEGLAFLSSGQRLATGPLRAVWFVAGSPPLHDEMCFYCLLFSTGVERGVLPWSIMFLRGKTLGFN